MSSCCCDEGDKSCEEQSEWRVVYAREALRFLVEEVASKRVYDRIDAYRHILASFPEIGGIYDPEYPAAIPPVPCRCVPIPGTAVTLYYALDKAKKTIVVLCFEWQRADPLARFSLSESSDIVNLDDVFPGIDAPQK